MSISSAAECRAASTNQSRKRAMAAPLPESVAWLAHVSMDMSADFGSNFGRTATYRLTVVYRPDKELEGVRWTLERSWEDFRTFQRRLLKKMRLGHACGAECGWLYKVDKHYFPKASLLCNNCPKVVETRRQTLLTYLATVQASLLNRGNHGCAVLLKDVGRAFSAFIVGSSNCTDALEASSSERSTRGSYFSETSAEEEESEGDDDEDSNLEDDHQARGGRNMVIRLAAFAETCGVCHSRASDLG